MKIAILAGGGGSRLWPWSREKAPKQVQKIFGEKTLLQRTVSMLCMGFKPSDIIVVTGASHAQFVINQLRMLPKHNIIVEPMRKDSAGAIGLAAAHVYAQNPEEILLSAPSDSWIREEKKFISLLKKAQRILSSYPQHTLLFGIRPQYPETGYGYIQLDKKIVHRKTYQVFTVKRFVEKPTVKKAAAYVAGGYLWNPSWCSWRVDHLMDLYRTYLPGNFRIFKKLSAVPQRLRQRAINNEFKKLTPVSIDYGILERTKHRLVVPAPISWSDVGHWRAVREMSPQDKEGNVITADAKLIDCANSFFGSTSKKFIAGIGIRDIVLVETEDVILLVHKDRAQDVKQMVASLRDSVLHKRYV